MTVYNGKKWTISVIGGFELLEIVSDLCTKQCVYENTGSSL